MVYLIANGEITHSYVEVECYVSFSLSLAFPQVIVTGERKSTSI